MRKTFLLALTAVMVFSLVLFFSGINSPQAKVTGECSNCHTMHNSQGGQPMTFDGGGPYGALVRGDCVGCHSNSNSAATIKTVGSSNIPVVYNTVTPTNPLAGGNFYWKSDETKVHNVYGIAGQDSNIGSYTPPGWKVITGWGTQDASWNQQLRCAGAYGCHGNRSSSIGTDQFAAIRGAHHGGTTLAGCYRFLMGAADACILGKEDPNWEHNPSSGHNVYKGVTDASSNQTISYLCSECHGYFHRHSSLGGTGSVGSTSPWLRHPTDNALAASGSSYFETDYGTTVPYNTETPVGFADPAKEPGGDLSGYNGTFTNGIVICLSCHRAHGTQYADILRFDYSAIKAGQNVTTGCNRCHKRQQ